MKKYVVLTTLLCLVMITGLAACGNKKEPVPVDPAEYDALYEKYVHAIDIGMIFNSSWDDANNVEPQYYLYYYAESFLQSGGKFEVTEDGMYIPQDELETFVQSHFDVTTEHLRTNEYYIPEKSAYEFGGLGSTWYCEITSAEQSGKLLTIKYDVFNALDIVNARGILAIEVNGENYKYLSNECEESAQAYLEYPNVINNITDQNGVLSMDSGSGITLGNPELNIHEYSGNKLSDVIYYYENVALPALEAKGAADTDKYEDGWYWSGTYRGGKPLVIDVRRKFGGDTYIIAAAYEDNADIEAARATVDTINLDNLDRLYFDYLFKPFYSGLLDSTWTVPFNIENRDALVRMYALVEERQEDAELRFPASDVDRFLERYFEEGSPDMIRGSVWHDKATDTYFSDKGFSDEPWARVTNARRDGDSLVLSYEVYAPEHEEDGIFLWEGELIIILSEQGYKYASNIMRYPLYPITQDAAYLDEITEKYVRPLVPYGSILVHSWPAAKDISSDNLIDFCAYNNLLRLPLDENNEYPKDRQHGTAEQVEAAIRRYFDVSAEYLRTSSRYNHTDEYTKERIDGYVMLNGGGGGMTRALNAEQSGDLLKITVGLYGPDDEIPGRPAKTGLLTVRPDGDGHQYLSYELG